MLALPIFSMISAPCGHRTPSWPALLRLWHVPPASRRGLFADRHQAVAFDQQTAIAGWDRRRESRARASAAPFFNGVRRRSNVAAEISGGIAEGDEQGRRHRGHGVAGRQHRMRGAEPLALHECQASGRTRLASARNRLVAGPMTTASAAPAPFGAAPSTCASSDWPATGCRTFGMVDRIRVPSPAASRIVRLVLPVIRFLKFLGECRAAAVIKCFRPQWETRIATPPRPRIFKIRPHSLRFAVLISAASEERPDNLVMAKDTDQLARMLRDRKYRLGL